MVTRDWAVSIWRLFESVGFFWRGVGGWMMSEVYKRQVDTRDELLNRILGASVRVNIIEGKLRRTKSDFRIRVAKCVEADSGVYRIFIMKCNNFVISVSHLSFKH